MVFQTTKPQGRGAGGGKGINGFGGAAVEVGPVVESHREKLCQRWNFGGVGNRTRDMAHDIS